MESELLLSDFNTGYIEESRQCGIFVNIYLYQWNRMGGS